MKPKAIEISKEAVETLAKRAGIKEICEFESYCQDSDENARQDFTVTIVGIDAAGRKKRYFFQATTWEEIVNEKT